MNTIVQHQLTRPFAAAILVILGLHCSAVAAPLNQLPVASETEKVLSTDSIIGEASAFERTRPFPVADKRAYFTNIKEGDKVNSPFRVAFAVSGMGVAPVSAGSIPGTGHHHILIDKPLPIDIKAPIPFDKPDEMAHPHYKHFGKGETETLLSLPLGKHTLQLLFADNNHVPYYIKSNVITIEVLR